ncbi:MAG TPA: polysaccharide biosynthesis/export family protein [Candidatus Binatia bacterium]|jgi:polysaccharide export outer membrane protein
MKKLFLFCSIVLTASVIISCAKELRVKEYQVLPDTPDPTKPSEEYYVIGPGDALNIQLWNEPTLSGAVKVRPDGYVTLPLVNEVQVTGLTTGELRKILAEKYKAFVSNPVVTIRIEGIASSEVFLVGQVNKPGAYPLQGNDTLLQLITRAGGLTIFADRRDIRVVRRLRDKVTEYTADYDAILAGDLKQDIILRPGDRIIVN